MDINRVSPRRVASGFAASHCRQCKMGWTRTDKDGGVLIVCLLDREPVLADMTSCDRYELREAEASGEAAA